MDKEKIDMLNRWVEKHDATPFFDALFAPPPDYTRRTIQEPIEPYHAIYVQVDALLTSIERDVDEDYWEPGANYYALDQIRSDLRDLAFRTVPNPEYDEERAELWHEAHPGRRPWNSTTMVTGQSYNPEVQRGPD